MIDITVCLYDMSYCVCFRAETGHGCRLLEDDLGTEISHYCHADKSEREKRGLCLLFLHLERVSHASND